MPWSAPRTFADGEVERARYFNQTVRDNLREFAGYFSAISTSESTTTTSYTDLATIGPVIACTAGGTQMVAIFGTDVSPTAAARCEGWMSIAVESGGVQLTGGSDNYSAANDATAQNRNNCVSWMTTIGLGQVVGVGGIVAGSAVTITAKYRAANANGATFGRRYLYVIPVGP